MIQQAHETPEEIYLRSLFVVDTGDCTRFEQQSAQIGLALSLAGISEPRADELRKQILTMIATASRAERQSKKASRTTGASLN